MKTLLALLCLGFLSGAAFADEDAAKILADAQKAQNDAPAYRMKISTVEPTMKKDILMTMEIVNPDQFHMKVESEGAVMMEMMSDGKEAYMAMGGGPMKEAPPEMASKFAEAKKQGSLQAMAKEMKDLKLVGHETVDGTAASVYTFNSEMGGVKAASKMWIGDKDHRPIKADIGIKGDASVAGAPGVDLDMTMKMTFEYDPSIKIALPNKQ